MLERITQTQNLYLGDTTMTTALVRVPVPPNVPSSEFETAFGIFYRSVVNRFPKEMNPVIDAILMDGCWPLFMAAAERIGLRLDSAMAVETVMERVDRVLAVGLRVRYGTPELAAEAFLTLLRQIDRAFVLGLRPGKALTPEAWRLLRTGNDSLAVRELAKQTSVPVGARATLWQTPVYQFMAECLKAARQYGEEIEREQRKLTEAWFYRGTDGQLKCLTTKYRGADPRFAMLEVATDELNGTLQKLLIAKADLAREQARQAMCKALPIDPAQIDSAIDWDELDRPEHAWLKTQVILTVLGVVGRQSLETDEYLPGIGLVKTRPPEELQDALLERMFTLGFPREPELVEELREQIRISVAVVRRAPSVLSIGLQSEFFIHLDVQQLSISSEEALELAMGEDPHLARGVVDLSSEEYERLREQVFSLIRWDQVTLKAIGRMLKAQALTFDQLIDGVARMVPGEERHEAAQLLLKSGRLSRQQIGTLFANTDVDVNLKNLTKYLDVVPQNIIDRFVLGVFNQRFKHGHDQTIGELELQQLITVFNRVSQAAIASLTAEAKFRPMLTFLVSAGLYNEGHPGDLQRLRQQFDRDELTWRYLGLSALVELRRSNRMHAKNTEAELEYAREKPMVSWYEAVKPGTDEHNDMQELFGERCDVVAELCQTLAAYSEESVLRWLYADRKNLEILVAKWSADCAWYELNVVRQPS